VQRYIVTLERINQKLDELGAIPLVEENVPSRVASSGQMIKRAPKFNPQWPGHTSTLQALTANVKCEDLTPQFTADPPIHGPNAHDGSTQRSPGTHATRVQLGECSHCKQLLSGIE